MADERLDFSCSRIGGKKCEILEQYDPETCCHVDKMECQAKIQRIEKWRKAVEYHAEHKINNLFFTSAEMFTGCPVSSCPRKYGIYVCKQR